MCFLRIANTLKNKHDGQVIFLDMFEEIVGTVKKCGAPNPLFSVPKMQSNSALFWGEGGGAGRFFYPDLSIRPMGL